MEQYDFLGNGLSGGGITYDPYSGAWNTPLADSYGTGLNGSNIGYSTDTWSWLTPMADYFSGIGGSGIPASSDVNVGNFFNAAASALGSAGGSLLSSLANNPGAALSILGGGLLGNLSGAKQTGEQTVKSVPWDLQQPYLLDAFEKGKSLAGITPTNGYMQTALNNAQNVVGSPLTGQAQSAVSNLLARDPANGYGMNWSNPFLGMTANVGRNAYEGATTSVGSNPMMGLNNPYLQSAIDQAQGDVTRQYNMTVRPQLDSAMRASGSFGNTGVQQMQAESQRQLASELGRVSTGMRMADYTGQQGLYENAINRGVQSQQTDLARNAGLNQNYQNNLLNAFQTDASRNASLQEQQYGRNLGQYQWGANAQNNAAFNVPQFNNQQLSANNSLFGLGQQAWQNQFTPTLNYGQMVQGSYGGSQTSPIFSNPWAQTLGGAATGAGIYSQLFGNKSGG